MIRKHMQYINTAISGLVIVIEHNLGGFPFIGVSERLVSGQRKYTSLFDSRFGEFKNLDDDRIQLTFASAYEGYIELFVVEVEDPTVQERLLGLEQRYLSLIKQLESRATVDQVLQIDTLTQTKIDSLQNQLDTQISQINLIKQDIEAL